MPWKQIKNYTKTVIFQGVSKNANPWTTKANMPTAREVLTSSVVNNKIYVIGGHNGSSPLSKNEEYDPITILLAPVKSGDIVYYRGNCIVKVNTQTIPSDIPTTIVKGGYLTLESGTLEYGWLKE